MVGILGWIIFGLIVGAIAKLLMPGKDPGGYIVTALLGIAGAVVGGFLVMALIGAVVLLALYRMMVKRPV
jgi:uncharacterized membrane protein YeaQ/YmgE (transglycosylase-associated protein family)